MVVRYIKYAVDIQLTKDPSDKWHEFSEHYEPEEAQLSAVLVAGNKFTKKVRIVTLQIQEVETKVVK